MKTVGFIKTWRKKHTLNIALSWCINRNTPGILGMLLGLYVQVSLGFAWMPEEDARRRRWSLGSY